MAEAESRALRVPQTWVLGPAPSPTLDELLDAREASSDPIGRLSTVENLPTGVSRRLLTQPPPLQESGLGGVLGHRAVVEAELEEEVVGRADVAGGPDAEQLHDLVAVEVGTEGVELLLLAELGDAGLEWS